MKAAMNILGFISVFAITTGVTFKMMHWPGAGISMVGGVFLFNVGFLPLYFIDRYKRSIETKAGSQINS
ncbi:MAG: hypothetical protein R2799_09555 [Crocinitomicaceae bacterium]|nr:hypothetical protein [Crocinitomicaceae bacterium]